MNPTLTARLAIAAALIGLLTACAPATRVTLLPQAGGASSAVAVSTGKGEQVLNQPYQVADVSRNGTISPGHHHRREGARSLPPPDRVAAPAAERFVLQFEPGTSQLTAESQTQLSQVLTRAGARAGGEIVVTGHTDRQGSVEANDQLSLERAQAIRALLIERGFDAALIEAVGRGEREPAVPTDDEVAEPRNRRAEVVVR